MKFVIAGAGSIGRRHSRNLQALGESDILFYRTGQGVLPDDELAGFPVERDLQAALAHRPDALIVSNPTALHLDIAIPAAQAGCHLFLEKPISHSLERLDELQAAVRRGGGQVLVGYQFRFHPGLRQARRLLAEGAIGRPISVRAHWGEYLPCWHPWEDYRRGYSARADLGGGVILTLSHPLDYLRWLLGEVSALWAFAGQLSDLELQVEDTAEIGLRFANRVLGSVHLDYNQRPPSHRLEIIGAQGAIRWDNADGATHVHRASDEAWQAYPPPQGFERNHLFLEQMHHFLEVVKGRAEPECSLDDGVKALQLALAAHASQVQGQMICF
ncbi:MAG: Gfo/Idh/MocA family oxidoreductase [Anaerolineales bacterium]|nr:Gfo/Idh/MocA family oxidoreductase [Anaerolineales bacterium]